MIYTYTTPTLEMDIIGVDLSNAETIEITIKQGNNKLKITDGQVDGTTWTKMLTQEESAMFTGTVLIQARIKLITGEVIPTDIIAVPWAMCLAGEEL